MDSGHGICPTNRRGEHISGPGAGNDLSRVDRVLSALLSRTVQHFCARLSVPAIPDVLLYVHARIQPWPESTDHENIAERATRRNGTRQTHQHVFREAIDGTVFKYQDRYCETTLGTP